ncbi:MAG: hypothetical protein R2724_32660 [Bryobacterales bacterium]
MRPLWKDRDLRFAQTGLLGFTPEQGGRMRSQSAARAIESYQSGPILRAGPAEY